MRRALVTAMVVASSVFTLPADSQSLRLDRVLGAAERASDLRGRDSDQQRIGEQMAATLLGASSLSPHAEEHAYVARVGHWVARHSDKPDLEWRFGVLDDDSINAFAAPGGHVLVTRGLLLQLNNEAELAGVLAHEIAHVTREHHLKAIRTAAGIEVAAGALSRARGGRDRGQSAVEERVLNATRELYARGLDRGDEFEADLWALTYMARAGYDPYAFAAVLQWLDARGADDTQLALMLATHPAPAARLERVGNQLDGQYAGLEGLALTERFRETLAPASPR